jgi:hypothetical protein
MIVRVFYKLTLCRTCTQANSTPLASDVSGSPQRNKSTEGTSSYAFAYVGFFKRHTITKNNREEEQHFKLVALNERPKRTAVLAFEQIGVLTCDLRMVKLLTRAMCAKPECFLPECYIWKLTI